MLCEQCQQNEAVLFIQESAGDTSRTIQLCKQCAAEIGIYQEGQINLDIEKLLNLDSFQDDEEQDDWLNDFLFNDDDENIDDDDVETLKCDNCGLTAHDLESSDSLVRMGCPECYKAFATMLNPLLGKLHYGTVHRSTRDGNYAEKSSPEKEARSKSYIRKLKEEMTQAVVAENYEEAANIRDQISEYNNKNRSENQE